jgi:hypothetical protein
MCKKVLLLVILFTGVLVSCQKSREKNVVVSRDYAIFQQNLSEILPLLLHITQSKDYLNRVIQTGGDTLHTEAGISLVSGDTSNISLAPVVIELDYTDTEEVGPKSGIINVTIYQYSRWSGGNLLVKFENFKVNNSVFSGQLQLSRISGGNFSISQANFYMVDSGKKINYESFITYSIDRGPDLDVLADDVLTIIDNGEFTNRNKVTYAVTNIGIIRNLSCRYIEKGLVELINDNNVTQVLDFGSGCDNEATVSYDGSVLNVSF